ncbi:MAG: DEAD/DEAH box helicase family protein [Prevotella sp.]|nr:DEAD/DEAH box helicase family protein [Prevotella sp.]
MNKAKDFQNNSADCIVSLFKNGQKRVLLADEVGLGKTIVAKAVIEKMRENARQQGRSFKVIYVCSNQSIIQQNANKLGISKDNVVPLSESRLSMQHRILFEQIDKDYLIPITPSTSLQQTNSYGNANERSLIYSLICGEFHQSKQESLKWYFDTYADIQKEPQEHTKLFRDKSIEHFSNTDAYYISIQKKMSLRHEYSEIINNIKAEIELKEPQKQYINELRTMFCEISIDMLHPDLVIMDEFQRYRNLMKDGKTTEENLLAQKLFNAESHPNIMLVSATPYKPMATMEEITQTRKNEHFEDFNELMRFLMKDNYDTFQKIWTKYSDLLGTLSKDSLDELIEVKKVIEEELRKVMVRTERYVPNLSYYEPKNIVPTSGEVKEYRQFRNLLTNAANKLNDVKTPSINIDYIKSSPFLLSFMQQYVEKDYIKRALKEKTGPPKNKFEGLLLNKDDLLRNKPLNCHHARLEALKKLLFTENNAANLLWIPASMPYYHTNGIFNKLSDFSKILVFSKWGFVPRMIATIISYEASRIFPKAHQDSISSKESANHTLDNYKELLMSPFPEVAKLFSYPESCDNIQKIKNNLKISVDEKLRSYKKQFVKTKVKSYKNLLKIIKLLNGDTNVLQEGIGFNDDTTTIEIVNIILASPGICMWRCFGDDYGNSYNEVHNGPLFKFTNAFVNMLSDEESQRIIRKNTSSKTAYDRTIEYCVLGNLQAVIDEYAYVIGYYKELSNKSKIWETMEGAIITRSPLDIDTNDSFCISRGKKFAMPRWFASDYSKITSNDNQEKRKMSIQSAFNSPFRPFVLASTSVGQEGLDFHLYCRKIVHWNLPANPINLEQRNGRINRYEGLAIRRNVAHLFKDIKKWQELFNKASEEWKKLYPEYNDMVPHWCLPEKVLENPEIEKIENIFLLYPLSSDQAAYEQLMKKLSLYRFTMGQPDQEFIINLLSEIDLSEDKKDKLTFHLCPQ